MPIVRVNSHRCRQRMTSRLGRYPTALYSWGHGSGFYEVTDEEIAKLFDPSERRIPGLTRSRTKRHELCLCWS